MFAFNVLLMEKHILLIQSQIAYSIFCWEMNDTKNNARRF